MPPGSVIIGTTSEQAYDPSPDLYDYAQTKAATMNFVKSLAKQLGPKGIRVNGVAPGRDSRDGAGVPGTGVLGLGVFGVADDPMLLTGGMILLSVMKKNFELCLQEVKTRKTH